MALTYDGLAKTSDDELKRLYDATAEHVQLSLSFLRDELMRREFARQNQRMERMTKAILWLTLVNTLLVAADIAVGFLRRP